MNKRLETSVQPTQIGVLASVLAKAVSSIVDRFATSRLLVGDEKESGRSLARRTTWATTALVMVFNIIGIAVASAFVLFVLPKPDGYDNSKWFLLNAGMIIVYGIVALIVGRKLGTWVVRGGKQGTHSWVPDERRPTEKQKKWLMRAPIRLFQIQLALWGFGSFLFALVNAFVDPLLALGVGSAALVTGFTTSVAAYLVGEVALRPIFARAYVDGLPSRKGIPGLSARWFMSWALGTGGAVFGLLVIGIVAFTNVEMSFSELRLAVIVLSAISLSFGLVVTVLAVTTTVQGLIPIRKGMAEIAKGNFNVSSPVWDTTEIGVLQSGFNSMVHGLRERETIRDLFGKQVGKEVAEHALAEGIKLGGEVRFVTVLFVDIVGSTTLATQRPPAEVVAILNRFLATVIDVVEENGGWINKFEGDAALAIFGAPVVLDDHPGRALKAGREMVKRLRIDVPEIKAAVGVAAGEAMAGHIGSESRFEYTVIGDPVNQAARLTELAKEHPQMLVSNQETVAESTPSEQSKWSEGPVTVLRGRTTETRLFLPIS